MKGKTKNQKGITLIALIITIIILLILAMVSISLVINQGILDKAKYGVDKYKEEETAEQEKLAQVEEEMKKYGGNTPTEVGSYIKYNVPYTDIYSGIEYTETTGWRYLGKDDKGNQLIVSTGIPANLWYHYNDNIGNSANGWWANETEISTTSDELYQTDKGYNYNENEGEPNKYAAYGLRYNFTKIPFEYQKSGTSVSTPNTGIYRKVGSYNKGTLGEDAFKASGVEVVDVHNLTLAEMNRACVLAGLPRGGDHAGQAGFKNLTGTAEGLFDMRDLDGYKDNSYWYWLTFPDDDNRDHISCVRFSDNYVGWNCNDPLGVRAVVSLPSNIQLEVIK